MYDVNPETGRRIHWAEAEAEDDADRARIPVMTADVILESPERRIILDTKYYQDALTRRRGYWHGQAPLRQPVPVARLPAEPPSEEPGRGPCMKAFCCTRRSASR